MTWTADTATTCSYTAEEVIPCTTSETIGVVEFLLNFNGGSHSSTFTDDTGRHTVFSTAFTETTPAKFGVSVGHFTNAVRAVPNNKIGELYQNWDSWSESCHVYIATMGAGTRQIIGSDSSVATNGFVFLGVSGGKFIIGMRKLAVMSTLASGSTDISLNTWYHVELNYDKPNGILRLFVNGILEASVAHVCAGYAAYIPGGVSLTGTMVSDYYIDSYRYVVGCHVNSSNYIAPTSAYDTTLPSTCTIITPLWSSQSSITC